MKKTFFNSYINDMVAFDRIKWFCLIKLTLHFVKVSSSPSSQLLFAIVFLGETHRRSLSEVFSKIDVLENFANFKGKHQCWSLFLIELQAWRRLQHSYFPVKFAKILRTPFLQITFDGSFWTKPRRSLWFIVWRRGFLVIFWSSLPWLSKYHVKLVI